jgi:hypothetical protein
MTPLKKHYFATTEEIETNNWLFMLSKLKEATKAKLAFNDRITETDGSILLNVIVPSLQVGRRCNNREVGGRPCNFYCFLEIMGWLVGRVVGCGRLKFLKKLK